MREFEAWDKREVMTPTSFISNLKHIAETREINRQADNRSRRYCISTGLIKNSYNMATIKKAIYSKAFLGLLGLILLTSCYSWSYIETNGGGNYFQYISELHYIYYSNGIDAIKAHDLSLYVDYSIDVCVLGRYFIQVL